MHLLIFLEDEHKLNSVDDVNSCIRAYWPDPDTEPQLFGVVKQVMVHRPCGSANPRARIALSLQPPPPPLAPLSYSPPSKMEIRELNLSVINPLEQAISNVILYLQDLEETPNDSLKFHLLLSISNTLHLDEHRPLWPVLYLSSLLENTIAKEVRSIRADLADLPNKLAQRGPIPLPLPADTASVAELSKKMDDLNRETTSSLKSFAEAVKASVATPAAPPPHPPKAKNQPPALKGNLLPQAVIWY